MSHAQTTRTLRWSLAPGVTVVVAWDVDVVGAPLVDVVGVVLVVVVAPPTAASMFVAS